MTNKYRAIAVVEKGEIYFSVDDGGEIELYQDSQESYKILGSFVGINGKATLKKLILEEYTDGEKSFDEFRVSAQNRINLFFDRLKFLSEDYSASITSIVEIETPTGSTRFAPGGLKVGGYAKSYSMLSSTDCNRLGKVKNEFLDECIKRYNEASQFSDPVLRLINLYGIVELVAHSERCKRNEVKDFAKKQFNLEVVTIRARDLVAHGLLSSKPEDLYQALNLNNNPHT